MQLMTVTTSLILAFEMVTPEVGQEMLRIWKPSIERVMFNWPNNTGLAVQYAQAQLNAVMSDLREGIMINFDYDPQLAIQIFSTTIKPTPHYQATGDGKPGAKGRSANEEIKSGVPRRPERLHR